ncbi:flagellar export protein FliJ [Ideonella sp. BN130291]|uniref:flagellar export protein FliJ n=1 Tax=Ideonella sp. BN130291 TaxID=3112940 RepID=UPI002E276CAA|nr:flagellar export protein FliJ [Ideonella sp. BN130291]
MNQIGPLQVLLKQAESERDEALLMLQQAQARADAARQQAEQLQAYRGQYQQRWSQQFAQRGAIEIVHCYQGFNERLHQAITHQEQASAQSAEQLERARQLLQERELRVASVRKLIERRLVEQRRVDERRDQQLTDEAAQRSGWNTHLPSRMVNQFS